MRRAILVVLDGLGVGAMRDVEEVRPQDAGADSLAAALHREPAELPNLERLGLAKAAPTAPLAGAAEPIGSWGRSELGYPGADSYLGHQVMLGSDVSGVVLEPFAAEIDRYASTLRETGRRVEPVDGLPVLAVEDSMVLCDSLEADPGMNYNVTGSLELVDFEEIVSVARSLRATAPVARIIAVGGRDISMDDIVASLKSRQGAVGVDTPSLGVYGHGVELLHLGFAFASDAQTPSRAAAAGLPVTLIGKMADLVACDPARRHPAVDTDEVLGSLVQAMDDQPSGLIAANVQELDLAGHQESPRKFVEVLVKADRSLGRVCDAMGEDDLLIVCGDHGNDPTRGRLHTREEVPVLAFIPGAPARELGRRSSLADVGATVADWLEVQPPAVGTSFLEALL
jgi:phosphopentomutase